MDWYELSCGVTTFGEISRLNVPLKIAFMLLLFFFNIEQIVIRKLTTLTLLSFNRDLHYMQF